MLFLCVTTISIERNIRLLMLYNSFIIGSPLQSNLISMHAYYKLLVVVTVIIEFFWWEYINTFSHAPFSDPSLHCGSCLLLFIVLLCILLCIHYVCPRIWVLLLLLLFIYSFIRHNKKFSSKEFSPTTNNNYCFKILFYLQFNYL